MKSKGFTLIELLVVIAIIAVLAAILFPVFIGVRDKASATACLNNARQIGMAVMQYCDDNNGMYPTTQYIEPAYSKYGWLWPLGKYLKSDKVLRCRTKPGAIAYACNGCSRKDWSWCNHDSLWGFYAYWQPTQYQWYSFAAKVSSVKRPSKVIAVFEQARGLSGGDIGSGWAGAYFGQWDANGKRITPPHGGGSNFVFADGHAKWYSVVGHPCWTSPDGGSTGPLASPTWNGISFDIAY